jgi:hypothetical protein
MAWRAKGRGGSLTNRSGYQRAIGWLSAGSRGQQRAKNQKSRPKNRKPNENNNIVLTKSSQKYNKQYQ